MFQEIRPDVLVSKPAVSLKKKSWGGTVERHKYFPKTRVRFKHQRSFYEGLVAVSIYIYIYIPMHFSEWRVGTCIPTGHVVRFVAFKLSGVVEGTRKNVIGDHAADDVVSGFATTRRFEGAHT